MLVTLPLPSPVVRIWPESMVSFLQWFAFYSFAGLLIIPWLFCVYQIVTHQLGRTKRIKQILDETSAPKVVIVMPCYKEAPDILLTAVNSVVDCDYPPSCIHVFLSFDGDQEDELYLGTLEKLGVPLTLDSYPASVDVAYRGARVTISRFPHGGKRHCQKRTFQLIDKVYAQYLKRNDNLFILFIDSDCILDRVCLQNFVYDMELSPGNRRDMLAMTGVITSTTQKHSLITLLQDMEYVHGQLFERTVESGCGAVTCLPGALTMLRFSAFRRMAKYYFADKAEQCEDLFDFAKSHLGEDRWLTHLFMIGAKKRYQIQMCTSAFCKTEAVQTIQSLIKQRRRWFLGFITNEVCMLTDWRLWKRYPILVVVRFMQNTIRTTGLLFFIMLLALVTTTKRVDDLPVGFIAISLGLNWLMMVYFGAKLKRLKLWLYPVMFVVNPFFNWYYMVYGIFTAGQRTWGGPRADAAAADENTTAQEAIEQAEKAGDDLNIVPESFIPAAKERKGLATRKEDDEDTKPHHHNGTSLPTGSSGGGVLRAKSVLQPPNRVIGKFAAPERTPSGYYQHPDDSLASVNLLGGGLGSGSGYHHHHPPAAADGRKRNNAPRNRDSFDSATSAHTGGTMSVYMPRRVESIMGNEDKRKYELAHANQFTGVAAGRTSRGVMRGQPPPGQVYEFSDDNEMVNRGFVEGGDDAPYRDREEEPARPQQHRRVASAESVGSGASEGDEMREGGTSLMPPPQPGQGQTGRRRTSSRASGGSNDHYHQHHQHQGGHAAAGESHLMPPSTAARGSGSGRSPLARASFVRTPTSTDEVESEIDESHAEAAGSHRMGSYHGDQRGPGCPN